MKKMSNSKLRTTSAGCAYSEEYNGSKSHVAVASEGSKKIYTWYGKCKGRRYTWRCGCGKKFYTYFYY